MGIASSCVRKVGGLVFPDDFDNYFLIEQKVKRAAVQRNYGRSAVPNVPVF